MRMRTTAAGALAVAATFLGATPALAASSSPVASAPLCTTSQLTASLSGANAGAGNFYDNLVLTNHGTSSCHVHGYPGVSVLDASGNQIGPAATYVSGATADTVVLAPGDSASDTIHTGTGAGTGFCEPAGAGLRVYPPGNTARLFISGGFKVCDHVFSVTPLAAGTSGNPEGSATVSTQTPEPTPSAAGGGTKAPSVTPRPVPSEVAVVPSGAPDTGVAGSAGTGGTNTPVIAAAAGGVVLASGAGVIALRRRSRARG